MPRNRQLTRDRIRDASLRILRLTGFAGWGVNAIAREAGVDKVLLYRYFGSLEGLLEALYRETLLWPDPQYLPVHSAEAFIEETLRFQHSRPEAFVLLSHPPARQTLSGLTRAFNQQGERWLHGFLARTSGHISREQLQRLPALILHKALSPGGIVSAHELWKQVSPPLRWEATPRDDEDELPTELL